MMVLALWFLGAFLAAPPQEPLRDAVKALEEENYIAAAELLEKTLENNPENVEARFNLAYAYTQLEQDGRAIEQYEKVLSQKPDLPQARMNLGLLLMRQERPGDAALHFKAVAEARPDDFRAQFHYAHALDAAGDFGQAIGPYEKASALDPQDARAALGLGRSLARAGRIEEAVEHYQRAARLDPELAEMTLELAELLEKNDRHEPAIGVYQQYLDAHPEAIAVRERVGFLLMQLKRYSEAIPMLEQAVGSNATAANLTALAEAYALSDQPEKALPRWREAVAADPASADLRFRFANALLADSQFQEASRNYLAALERNAALADAWNGLAFSLYKLDNYEGALKALTQSHARSEEKPASIFLMAIVQDKLQMYEEALASYQRFLAAHPGLEDEEWKAQERAKAIEKILKKRRR